MWDMRNRTCRLCGRHPPPMHIPDTIPAVKSNTPPGIEATQLLVAITASSIPLAQCSKAVLLLIGIYQRVVEAVNKLPMCWVGRVLEEGSRKAPEVTRGGWQVPVLEQRRGGGQRLLILHLPAAQH